MLNKTHRFATSPAPVLRTMSATVLRAPTLFRGMWGRCLIGDEETEGRPRQKRETKPSKFVCKLFYSLIYSISNRCSTKPTDSPHHLPQCPSNDVCRKSGKDGDDLPRARRCRRQRQQRACMFFLFLLKLNC